VLTKGSINGSRTSSLIPSGGHTLPTVIAGERLTWKNDQKNGKNSMASEAKNRSIPIANPNCTSSVCLPSITASRISSRAHDHITNKIKDKNCKSLVSTIESGKSLLGNAPVTEKKGSMIPAPTSINLDASDTFCNLIINVMAKLPTKAPINTGIRLDPNT